MGMAFPYAIRVKLPSDLDIIPSIRKYISEVLQVFGFSAKFAFRTEIIVDAICNNAITHGSDGNDDDEIEILCKIGADRVEVVVKDKGGSTENIERLKETVNGCKAEIPFVDYRAAGMGLEIVKLLSETIELTVDENNLTSIHVIRKREDVN